VTIRLSRELILAIHDEQLAEHGGSTGLRDPGLLDSAVARPLNRPGHDEPDTVELAAVYALAIARNHPFIDANKRTAFVALELFLRLNGLAFTAGDAESVVMTLAMAAGELPDAEFIAWVRMHTATEPR
jgi:death on curing protein